MQDQSGTQAKIEEGGPEPKAKLIILSGAGLSAESGLKTFRGASGLWEGEDLTQVCNIDTWRVNFEKVHKFYNARRQFCQAASPNAAHLQIAQWHKTWPDRTILLTQNIDSLLESAGCERVIHLHGLANKMRCMECDHVFPIAGEYANTGCPECQTKWVKPHVVFFGEMAPAYEELNRVINRLTAADLLLIIGTSGQVIQFERMVGRRLAHSILLNLEEGEMNERIFTERRYGPATQTVPALDPWIRQRMEA